MPIDFADHLRRGYEGSDPLVSPEDLLRDAAYGVQFPTGQYGAWTGRLFVFSDDVADGLVWTNLDMESLASAARGDLARYDGAGWVRLGNVDAAADAQQIIDQISGDTGGDIDFTRDGDGDEASLRGEIRPRKVMQYSSTVTLLWAGTQAEYDAMTDRSATGIYFTLPDS